MEGERDKRLGKLEGRVEKWWITVNLIGDGGVIFGEFYGLQGMGFKEGSYHLVDHLQRVDFIRMIAETPDAYIFLGEPQNIERVLGKLTLDERDKKEKDKKEGGDKS